MKDNIILPSEISGVNNTLPKTEVDFIGNNSRIREIYSVINLVSDSTTPVLITGESGTGKDVVARLIHSRSPRAGKPYIAINCAAVPRDVFENELFGHEQGAFTGAISKKMGYFEMANGGTLFFDEIAEMAPETQAKLLRVIESKSLRRLGGKEELFVDVRLLAATNKKMDDAINSGEMRKDLYYRFSVIEIHLPPLRERKEDISILIEYFLSSLCKQQKKNAKKFSDAAFNMMLRYNWPGNVRELKNVIERLVIMCQEDIITPNYLPVNITDSRFQEDTINITVGTSLKNAEREIILRTLNAVDNNKSRAANLLGVSRKALYNKLDRIEG
ncbi:MAG: two component sigma54 specific Fis family transcriptional regulator [Stygiobacter sp.]|nr:MAG: two component sigma54 specific Fis family transcriptional regulator [Stygiobacter sp.]KAF0217799.1 MAG: two component sigma54 specific Fis family transcriptional [Ignavibacteria bacterium]